MFRVTSAPWMMSVPVSLVTCLSFFFFNDPAPPEISPLPLHDALPIPKPGAVSTATPVSSNRAPPPPGACGNSIRAFAARASVSSVDRLRATIFPLRRHSASSIAPPPPPRARPPGGGTPETQRLPPPPHPPTHPPPPPPPNHPAPP